MNKHNKRPFQNQFRATDRWRRQDNAVNINNVGKKNILLIKFLFFLLIEIGSFVHACEGEMLYASTHTKIPYFNAPVYLENKV